MTTHKGQGGSGGHLKGLIHTMKTGIDYLDLLLASVAAEIIGNGHPLHQATDDELEEAAMAIKTFRHRWARAVEKVSRQPVNPEYKYSSQ